MKLTILNAFPSIVADTREQKIENLVRVYEAHLRLNEEWEGMSGSNGDIHAEVGTMYK